MHMQGDPQTMQDKPFYVDVVQEVLSSLLQQAEACLQAGIRRENIVLDPGIGFGKTLDHNLELLKNLDVFTVSGFAVLLGTSRKSFIEKIMQAPVDPADRLGGSIATVLRGLDAGVRVFRVHDVAATKQAIAVWRATRPL
jgi:dihydropteroate synthase